MGYKTITEKDSYHARMAEFIQQDFHNRDVAAMWKLLKSTEGRWFIMRLLDQTNINAKAFTGNSNTFYNEGRRDVGLGILSAIDALGIEAIKLKQKAELEYIENKLRAQELATKNEDEEKGEN